MTQPQSPNNNSSSNNKNKNNHHKGPFKTNNSSPNSGFKAYGVISECFSLFQATIEAYWVVTEWLLSGYWSLLKLTECLLSALLLSAHWVPTVATDACVTKTKKEKRTNITHNKTAFFIWPAEHNKEINKQTKTPNKVTCWSLVRSTVDKSEKTMKNTKKLPKRKCTLSKLQMKGAMWAVRSQWLHDLQKKTQAHENQQNPTQS